jgi:spore germination cell wall hydrolase CwlJ-like protein
MHNVFRTAALVVIALSSMTAIAGSGAIGAPLKPSATARFELPASVIEAAVVESDATTITDFSDLPQTDVSRAEPRRVERAASLGTLVAQYSSPNTLSAEDECLAVAIYFESKGEPLTGQLAVAHTVLNRAKSGRFPASVCGVVKQPNQFSFVRRGGFPPIARGSRDWQEAVGVATVARGNMWKSGVSNALYFHATRVSPRWKLTRIASVGNHVFYR